MGIRDETFAEGDWLFIKKENDSGLFQQFSNKFRIARVDGITGPWTISEKEEVESDKDTTVKLMSEIA